MKQRARKKERERVKENGDIASPYRYNRKSRKLCSFVNQAFKMLLLKGFLYAAKRGEKLKIKFKSK